MAARRKRILILMSDTGGGHRASAQALRDGFQLQYGDQYQVWPLPSSALPTGSTCTAVASRCKALHARIELFNCMSTAGRHC